mgnify:CR=1 FL=1
MTGGMRARSTAALAGVLALSLAAPSALLSPAAAQGTAGPRVSEALVAVGAEPGGAGGAPQQTAQWLIPLRPGEPVKCAMPSPRRGMAPYGGGKLTQ